ncbi:hypothetical protein C8D97_10833 [Pleionea mediterranea]|uniref:Uncharacterized protein n=1 Tax=Pleionea mediterranea TaxID=523701 RepID=A0A316FK93_9GAMM|nr:hypothetical protein C8D97_10833 [Pleionea mediterranea]
MIKMMMNKIINNIGFIHPVITKYDVKMIQDEI